MVRYRIHLMGSETVTIDAVKVNRGVNDLCFFDAEDNLVGLFYWRNVLGFSVEGSATDQVITDRVPFDMGKITPEEYSEETRQWLRDREERRDKGTPQVNPSRNPFFT